MVRTIVKSVRQYKKASFLSMLFVPLEVGLECIIPLIMSQLVDSIENSHFENLWWYSIALIVMALLSLACGALAGKFSAYASTGFASNLRDDLFNNIQRFSFSNIDTFSASSLVTRMTTDVNNVQQAFMVSIRMAIRSPLMLIFSVIMAFVVSPKLAWIFILMVPFILLILVTIIYFAVKVFTRVFKKYDTLNNSIQENIQGIRTVKSYVREDYEDKKFYNASESLRKEFTRAERIIALNNPTMQFAIYVVNLAVIFIGAYLVVTGSHFENGEVIFGELSTGGLSSLLVYGMQILMSLMMFSMIIVMITISIESAKRINEVLVEQPTIKNPENPITSISDGSIEFKNVNFKYNNKADKNVLSNINLKINSGETIGIIGGTGSGKTSLVSLISRIYDVSEGEVLVGGHNVKEYDVIELREAISMVLQKNVLFSGTIKENLRWGDKNASDEELVHACKLAQADSFIQNFNDKYDTYIEQGGTNVSGGQKQRLCIARALLKKPKILILDDSTSAVDTKTDALIRKSFKEYIPNTTKIIIAQRISSIQDSDQIIVMDNGRIDAIGKHDELLKNNAIYKDIYYSQNKVSESEVK